VGKPMFYVFNMTFKLLGTTLKGKMLKKEKSKITTVFGTPH